MQEIAHERWKSFLEGFSLQHKLWHTTLNLILPEEEPRVEFCELPLLRIEMAERELLITLRDQDGRILRRVVRAPAHLWLEETKAGAHKSLQIESAEGVRTVLSFRSAVLPECLNGILKEEAN